MSLADDLREPESTNPDGQCECVGGFDGYDCRCPRPALSGGLCERCMTSPNCGRAGGS